MGQIAAMEKVYQKDAAKKKYRVKDAVYKTSQDTDEKDEDGHLCCGGRGHHLWAGTNRMSEANLSLRLLHFFSPTPNLSDTRLPKIKRQ